MERIVAPPLVRDPRTPGELKDELRRKFRTRRQHMGSQQRASLAKKITMVTLSITDVQHASCVALYVNRPSEPATLGLIAALSELGQEILLPKLGAGLSREWGLYRGQDDLVERAPGRPPEPGGEDLGIAALARADVILLPALAVDTRGTRLGQGGGWYDRACTHARVGVPLLAIVYEHELLDAQTDPLPRLEHDRLVDGAITPAGWRWLRLPDQPAVA